MHYSMAALHIPDGFLSVAVSVTFWATSVVLIWLATRHTESNFGERQIPLMGVMAAFIFAAQMINFPVAGGTSGHFLGGALAAMVLGPWAGILVMTAVIALQALLFQDGGLLVMGANIFNMGILTATCGYGLYRLAGSWPRSWRMGMAGVAAWLSTVASALVTALQLWLSGTSPLGLVMPAMLGVHVLIGIGEAVVTVAALGLIERTRPDIANPEKTTQSAGWGWAVAGGLFALGTVLLAPFASADPDGLEAVAEQLGFVSQGQAAPFAILPDYTLPVLGDGAVSTIGAGVAGVIVLGLIFFAVGKLVAKKR